MTEFTELGTFLICVDIQLFCQDSKMRVQYGSSSEWFSNYYLIITYVLEETLFSSEAISQNKIEQTLNSLILTLLFCQPTISQLHINPKINDSQVIIFFFPFRLKSSILLRYKYFEFYFLKLKPLEKNIRYTFIWTKTHQSIKNIKTYQKFYHFFLIFFHYE